MQLYRAEHSDPTADAQRNLCGRTHYVDPENLRYHHSRVLVFRVHADGLLCSLVESCSLDMNNSKRGFRYVIFDVFGKVLERPNLDETFTNRNRAEKAMWAALETIDAFAVTKKAIQDKHKSDLSEYKMDLVKLKEMKKQK